MLGGSFSGGEWVYGSRSRKLGRLTRRNDRVDRVLLMLRSRGMEVWSVALDPLDGWALPIAG